MLLPAIRGKMGSTTFYDATMPAREVVSAFRPARDLDDWANMGIDERMQRDPNVKRIRDEIVPYLARSKDRLFGALIILVYKGNIEFEPLDSLGGKIPAAYKKVAEKIGFITVDGGELIVLDGQHRLLALRQILQDGAEGDFVSEVPTDDISVIFVQHESNEKTRRIFNKVNRYAKPTSRSDNIITSEDDGYAIVTRRLLDDGAPLGRHAGKDIVEWRSNTLSERSIKLTTLSAVYESMKDILAHAGIIHFDEKHSVNRPKEEKLDEAYEQAEIWWSAVLQLEPYKRALADPSSIPDMRKDGESYSMLFKPIGQIALFKGLVLAVGRGLPLEKAVKRVPLIDWNIGSPIWQNVIVAPGGRMIGRKEAYDLAANLIAYLLAPEQTTSQDKEKLKEAYNTARGYDFDQSAPGTEPEDLPEPKEAPTALAI
jgi:DNA sulfur modification protein DndB